MLVKKKNYIATAICDGIKKNFTVHYVTKAKANKVAEDVARSLFAVTCVSVLSLTIMK